MAKTEEKKEEELEKKIEVLKSNLPHGLPMKNIKDLKTSKTKAPGYATVAEAGQLMMSPESIKVMRETLDEKVCQLPFLLYFYIYVFVWCHVLFPGIYLVAFSTSQFIFFCNIKKCLYTMIRSKFFHLCS